MLPSDDVNLIYKRPLQGIINFITGLYVLFTIKGINVCLTLQVIAKNNKFKYIHCLCPRLPLLPSGRSSPSPLSPPNPHGVPLLFILQSLYNMIVIIYLASIVPTLKA